jgi:hypothetical protein
MEEVAPVVFDLSVIASWIAARYSVWLGSPVALKLDTMRRSDRAEQYPTPR